MKTLTERECTACKKGFAGHKTRKYCSKECASKIRKVQRNERDREMRKISSEIGHCTVCFKPLTKDNPLNYRACSRCRANMRVRDKRRTKK